MLVELNITPLGSGTHLSDQIAEVVKLIDASGLPYQLTPCGTCVEGEWDEVMPLVRRCHDQIRQQSPHVITTLQIEDHAGVRNKLRHNVDAVSAKLGKKPELMPA